MRRVALCLLILVATSPARAIERPVHTYSIVARDPATGDLGVAVQSHWFSVGSIVTWAEAGVGAIATQSFVEPAYGPRGLELMKSGLSAEQALEAVRESGAPDMVLVDHHLANRVYGLDVMRHLEEELGRRRPAISNHVERSPGLEGE